MKSFFILILIELMLLTSSVSGQITIISYECMAQHDIGKIRFNGGYSPRFSANTVAGKNCFSNESIYSYGTEYPKGSGINYLSFGAFYVGGIKGIDTLVSTMSNSELRPNNNTYIEIIYRNILVDSLNRDNSAVSEQDLIGIVVDTFTQEDYEYIYPDEFSHRPHIPLYIEMRVESYAWSNSYVDDFALFKLTVTNIGKDVIKKPRFGLFFRTQAGFIKSETFYRRDDIGGYLRTFRTVDECGNIIRDTVNIMWGADNDGDPVDGAFSENLVPYSGGAMKSCTGIVGVRLLKDFFMENKVCYNWWYEVFNTDIDFGPRKRENFRDFRTGGLGAPYGDHNLYYLLGNDEIDYGPIYTSKIRVNDDTWHYPDQSIAENISDGEIIKYNLGIEFGDLYPGNSFEVPLAYVAGENFHLDPNNINNLPHNPDAYYANVDFSDLVKNSRWASWVYDNPGVDTDGDGYYGKYRVCVIDSVETDNGWSILRADTQYYEGDGVPDWRAAGPPPAPEFWLEPTANGIKVCFNGSRTETEKDFMTGKVDFEGYNIWIGRDERSTSLSIVASYDLKNYDKFLFDPYYLPEANYVLFDDPVTLEQLRCDYGYDCHDTTFNPFDYTRSDPYLKGDSILIFLPHHYNSSEIGITTPIRKVYPQAPNPNSVPPDSITDDYYTPEGYFKYYEYEFTVEHLLPTVPYYINVTTFDHGSPESGLTPLETSKTVGLQHAYPLSPDDDRSGTNSKVYVYPNPYRIDGDYRGGGYEGRMKEHLPSDKVRSIHFANLPARCRIRIFSLDGDLVREMRHDFDESDPNHVHAEWNLVTRNRQLVVSGLYYWSVEDDEGYVQMGKLVIIM